MNKRVKMKELYPVMQEALSNGAQVCITETGTSMQPMLHSQKDTAVLKKPQARLKKYDLALYRRENGAFVLHRVVAVTENGYVMCGDNQTVVEHGITDANIIAVVKSFTRNSKEYTAENRLYRFYSRVWTNTRFIRRLYRGGKRRIFTCLRRLLH